MFIEVKKKKKKKKKLSVVFVSTLEEEYLPN